MAAGRVTIICLLSCVHVTSVSTDNALRVMPQPSNGQCSAVLQTLTCDDIPVVVPPGIRTVIILKYSGELPNNAFQDDSWRQIQIFRFTGSVFADIRDFRFSKLTNTTEMFLSWPDARHFSRQSLLGLDHVRSLIMVGMSQLDPSSFVKAFVDPRALPSIEEFTFNPGVHRNAPTWFLSNSFMETIMKRPIKLLNFSHSVIIGDRISYFLLLLKLDVLNISYAYILENPNTYTLSTSKSESIFSIDTLLNITNKMRNTSLMKLSGRPLLDTADCSGIKVPYGMPGTQHILSSLLPKVSKLRTVNPLFFKIVNLHANNVQLEDQAFTDSIDFRNYDLWLKRLYVRNNHILKVNCSLIFRENNSIELLDVSDNKIEFINPSIFATAYNLLYIYLANNKLNNMAQLSEFSILFKSQRNLLELDLSKNGFIYLPWKMFYHNTKLKLLNLAGNCFETIMFDLSRLNDLERLDLSYNAIRVLDGAALKSLERYLLIRERASPAINVDLRGNPLVCDCLAEAFIEWLTRYSLGARVNVEAPYCLFEGSTIEINQDAVEKCLLLCHRTLIVSLTVSLSVLLLLTVVITIVVCWKMKRRRFFLDKETNFKARLQNESMPQKYVVFLAYSSVDESLVNHVICPRLLTRLSARLDMTDGVVCTGNDFRPGFSILMEAYRLMESSCVFVAVVSEAFCSSPYCRAEVQEACNQNKPIIIIVLEELDEDSMSPYLQRVFRRYSRAKLVQCNDGFAFVPSIDIITDSILQLAINSLELLV